MAPIVDTDVLVIGGGGAGARAALSAAESGARVMLALKGLFGRLVVTAARARRESRGSHYRADFPATDAAARGKSLVARQAEGRLELALTAL